MNINTQQSFFNNVMNSPWKYVKRTLLGLFVLITIMLSYFTVDQYEGAVVTTWGKFSYVAGPGLHFKIPFAQSTNYFRTDIQKMSVDKGVNAYTIDNQEVDIVFTVFYRVPMKNLGFIYENAQDYFPRLFDMTVDRLKSAMGNINATHVAEQRGMLTKKIKGILAADAKSLGVEVTDFQLTNIEYTKSFRAAVDAAASAKANVETREQEKQQAIRVAEKAKIAAEGTANAVREKARGDADATLLNAKATSEAIRLRGEAEAKAIRAQAEALQQNQKLVELRKAERWDGKLPVQMLSGVVPFMRFDAPVQSGK